MKIVVYFALVMFVFTSCQHKSAASIDLEVIDLDAHTEEIPDIKEIHYIPLETTDSSLIADMNKIVFKDDYFYIFDSKNMSVLVFDRQGSFKKSIRKKGVGPSEYTFAVDMDVDKAGDIYIGDNATQRIVKYKAGDYTDYEVVNVKNYFLEFAVSEDKTVYIGDSYHNGKPDVKLARLDATNGRLDVIRKNEIEEGFVIGRYSRHYFFRSGNILKYYERFSPIIYSISNNNVVSSYFLKSNDYPSVVIAKEWAKDRKNISTDKDVYIRDISAFYEAGDYISLTIHSKLKRYALYDKRTKLAYNWDFMNSKMSRLGITGAHASDGEYFVSYCSPNEEKIRNILLHNPDMDSEMKDRLLNLSEDSNPIMILYKY